MAKDFKAAQLRTSQIIASGSKSGTPSLIIASASSPSVNFDGGGNNTTILNGVGKDVFVFISGSKSSKGSSTNQGVTVFGGDIVVSGSAYDANGNTFGATSPGGSTTQVQFNDGGSFGGSSGLTYNKSSDTLSVGSLYVTGTNNNSWISGSLNVSGSMYIGDSQTDLLIISSTIYAQRSIDIGLQGWKAGGVSAVTGSLVVRGGPNAAAFFGSGSQTVHLVGTGTNGSGAGIVFGDSADTYGVGIFEDVDDKMLLKANGRIQLFSLNSGVGINKDSPASTYALHVGGKEYVDSDLRVDGDIAVNGGDITSTATTFNLLNSTVTTLNIGAGATTSLNIGASAADVVVAGDLKVGGNDIKASDGSVAITLNGTTVTIPGDLTVNGTTTTVNTTNLVVKDPIIYFGSGTTSTNQNGGIALASGSNTTNQALVWGRVANDTWGAGKQDVTAGTTTSLASMNLVPIRGSKFEAGGSSTYISSSNGSSLEIAASTQVLILSGGSAVSSEPRNFVDTNFFVSGSIRSRGTTVRGTSVFGGDIYASGSAYFAQGISGSLTKLTDGTSYIIAGSGISITTGSSGAITITNDGTVGDITAVTAGTGLAGGGTSGAVTLNISDSVVATVSGTTFTGVVKVNSGISGSLTKLTDGTSYLIAGNNISITTGSTGAVTIAGTIPQATGTFNDVSAKLSTTGTFAVAGNQGFNYFANNVGSDVNFYVSGSRLSRGTSTRGTSVFGGDLYVSGTAYVSNSLQIGNTTLTEDADNDLTISAGRLVFTPSETDVNAFQVVTNGAAGLRLNSGQGGLGLSSGLGQFTVTSSQIVMGSSSPVTFTTPPVPGTDTFIFVSGALNSKDSSTAGAAVFGGDVVISGTLFGGSPLKVSGGLQLTGTLDISTNSKIIASALSGSLTKLSDGTSYLVAGSNVTITTGSNGAVTIASTGGGGGGSGDADATYLVLTATGSLNNERVITAGTGISTTDGGAGGNYTIEINDSVVATVSGTTFTGVVKANAGLSGSLTKLTDGTSYLIAGSNVTITTGSNGAVTIASTGGGGSVSSGSFNEVAVAGSPNSFVTTASISIAGTRGMQYSVASVGSDVNFFVSGTSGSKGTSTRGTSVFGGDMVVSGTVYGSTFLNVGQDLRVTGSIASNAFTAGSVLFAGNSGIITQDNTSIYFDDTNNRLGLLTTSPQKTLHVKGITELEGGGVTANLADQIVFAASTVPTSYLHKLQTSHDSTVAINNKITFDMWNGSTNLPMFSISGSGNSQFRGNLSVGGALTVTNASSINAISGTTQFPQGISGSLTRLTDGTSFLIAGSNVTITSGANGSVTIASTGGGGTVTTGSFNEAGGSLITTASVSLAGTKGFFYSASSVGADTYFFVSGSTNAKDGASAGVTVFGGQTVFSGAMFGGYNSFASITSQDIIAQRIILKGTSAALVPGSDTNFFVSGSTSSRNTATRGTAVFGGDALVSGTLRSVGDILAGSGYLASANGTKAMYLYDTSGDVSFQGKVIANNIRSSTNSSNTITLSGLDATFGGSVVIPGDLTVNGTTTTINTTNLEISDAVIGLGFSSGTVAINPAGDRGFIASVSGSNNAALLWKNANSEFAVGRTTATATGSLPVVLSGYSNFHAAAIQATIVTASLGFSGSLTKLTDGTSYLIAGNNVTITTGTNGSVTIASTGGGGSGTGFNDGGNKLNTTSSVAFAGTLGSSYYANNVGTDVFMFVSGSTGTRGTATAGTSVFGGEVVTSGSIYPGVDLGANLGSPSNRWGNIYTGDLHLRNERGDWTIVEEEDYLCVVNNKTGKKFKMALIPLEE